MLGRLPSRLVRQSPRLIGNAALSTIALRSLPRHVHRASVLSRRFATPPPQVKHSEMSTELYERYSEATLDYLLEVLEEEMEQVGDPQYEVEYSSGVLTLKLGDKGTYVINKQPPNKQIWLSSPFSGPKRYDYSEEQDDWIYVRDGQSLGDLLNQELSIVLEREVRLGLQKISRKFW
ncbi:Frataxin [Obba rivulosa]|uniref:ferroxidase n=1 Tax=Obba rivulosa TaxID=1052685 RepID=A0A8E2DVZ5_9APHY|nr:Frataxin [Obba rivulosa]